MNYLKRWMACQTIRSLQQTAGGYIRVLANTDKGLVAVDHKQNLTDSEISEAITYIGYPAKVASESEVVQPKAITSESPGWRSPPDGFFAKLLRIFSR